MLEFLKELRGDTNGKTAEVPTESKATDRRHAKRFPARRRTSCRPVERAIGEAWEGEVVDISETGLCLQLTRRFEPGTVLTVFLKDTPPCRHLVIQVMWTRKNAQAWHIGGRFDHPLCNFQLDELVLRT